jgi:BirA family transcriptional regulator, biotin operon repressor / biotin---[acetyl-CoA-carboxylase] ligase
VNQSEQISEEMVLGLLAEARDGYLSGEALSDKLGLPKATVFTQIDGLRAKGYQIDSLPRKGYRLVAVPDRLTGLELGPLLSTAELGRVVHAFEEVDSTNDVARKLAEDGAGNGELIIAEAQREGRGRRGRRWLSPPGSNLTFSIVLRPQLPPSRAPELTLTAAVALTEVLRDAGFDARIKWPNDLLVRGRKVAGILTELSADAERIHYAILGVGLNVNLQKGELPPEVAELATSLRIERGEPVPRVFLLAALLTALETWIERLQQEGFAAIRTRWLELSATLGKRVRVELGKRPLEGEATDLDADGALLVRDDAGKTHRVVAGDVELELGD